MKNVKAWRERIVIPTYEVGEPEKYPVFLDRRVYQASSGVVYPHPVIEHISDVKTDKEWDVVFIENDYVKIMVLPALGGRIQMAYDKVRARHFVYYNHVIKPALVGLTGPWISGGIEFNWPQHHRPSTYDPVDSHIEEHEDGSVTVWCSEVERMFRTKGMAGFRLYPDKAYLEINVKLYNRTANPQTFLWWANPAVAVNDAYQSVFPPDVNAVFDHGKRDVSEFPIAKGEYYKVDYSPGTDISRYKNIPVPTSYMAITSNYDFVGGFENDSQGGLLHVANHHVSPGKKQWTWGNGDFGKAWDRNLTDTNGPYIELMCGVFTDNQPDFSWLQPYEEKQFTQYFMPYHTVGVVKNATKDALLNVAYSGKSATLKVHVTGTYPAASISFERNGKAVWQTKQDLDPTGAVTLTAQLPDDKVDDLRAVVRTVEGRELVSWELPDPKLEQEVPNPARAAKQPHEIEHIEQLYLRGLHLEQYRHATYDATDYYLEALRRDPSDVRSNNAMGLWLLRKGQFAQALTHFDRAIETLTERNPNPYDGEPFYNKGLALRYLGRVEEAYGAFYKATWNAAWQSAGFFQLAQIDAERARYESAMDLVDKSLVRNWHHHKARHLKIMLLRKLGKTEQARTQVQSGLDLDYFNFGAWYERYLLDGRESDRTELQNLLRGYVHNYLEFALDYAMAGGYQEAIDLLAWYTDATHKQYPMVAYTTGWCHGLLGNSEAARNCYAEAARCSPDYCFPNRQEEVIILQAALIAVTDDARAHYYLGNFWYANKQYDEAKNHWEIATALDPDNAICQRNLALLYYNKSEQQNLARERLEVAFAKDSGSARLLMELDQLYKKQNIDPAKRLALLEENLDLTKARDDLYLERVALYNTLGEHRTALDLILTRQFHPWEGGEGKVPFQYLTASVELAKVKLRSGEYSAAVELLEAAQRYPHCLGEGKLTGVQENDIFYWLGCCYEKMNIPKLAEAFWRQASEGLSEPSPALFYNDQQPDKIFYQGLALVQLGEREAANDRFNRLLAYGKAHRDDNVRLDYFAVSLPDLLIWDEDLNQRNVIHCDYMMGLGHLGLERNAEAEAAFLRVLAQHNHHLPVLVHHAMAKNVLLKGVVM